MKTQNKYYVSFAGAEFYVMADSHYQAGNRAGYRYGDAIAISLVTPGGIWDGLEIETKGGTK
jgi:hypothetical protein